MQPMSLLPVSLIILQCRSTATAAPNLPVVLRTYCVDDKSLSSGAGASCVAPGCVSHAGPAV
jgi:hypothetical protein